LGDAPAEQAGSAAAAGDTLIAEARRRAFGLLDEWLAWVFVSDDDSVFAETDAPKRGQTYCFEVDGPLADPRDVLRYAHRGTGLFL
jgi:hypothetical protein